MGRMTRAAIDNASDDPFAEDVGALHLEQARLLVERTRMSCLIVEGVVIYFTALFILAGDYTFAASWLVVTSLLVGVVYLYPRLAIPDGVTPDNHRRYLRGHTVISGVTGLVWTGFAIAYLDPTSLLSLFITVNMVSSISLGGMLPSAEYRPTFLALATGMFLPFSLYWLITVDGPARLIGLGLLMLYGFGVLVSARAELQTLESLAARRTRELTNRLRAQNRVIEKASAEKSRFLAATSHDMSQPLQAQGFFIRAIRRTLDRPDQLALLDKIEASWKNQQSLLQALVETARLDSGAVTVKPRIFNITPVMNDLRSEFAASARDKSLTLSVQTQDVFVESDPLLVTRIMRNLLSNAVKFTHTGGRVELTARHEGAVVILEVTDDGPGVSARERDQIFEEYVQLDNPNAGARIGLGLGLPIVRQLVRRLDLELRFDSVPGEGTRASIAIPHRAAPPAGSSAPAVNLHDIRDAPLVVLVEDEPAVRDSLEILLTMWGCQVIAAGSGDEAVRLLSWADEQPDMLISDKRLAQGESGLETIERLRGEVLGDVPAILLTGDIHSFETAADIADLTILTKPVEPEQLHAVLVGLLGEPS